MTILRNGEKDGVIRRGLRISAAEQLAYGPQLPTEEPCDVVYDPEIHRLSVPLTMPPDSSQDVVLYLLRYMIMVKGTGSANSPAATGSEARAAPWKRRRTVRSAA